MLVQVLKTTKDDFMCVVCVQKAENSLTKK
jgi:hypothetical protein